MGDLFTRKYDSEILKELPHLKNYPEMLPFIGSNYEAMRDKIFILGESHYFDREIIDVFKNTKEGSLYLTDWYNQTSQGWEKERKEYIDTRWNLIQIEVNKKRTKPLTSYYNLKKELGENVHLVNKEMVFSNFVYFNYFQRPAFISGESVINNEKDNEIAYSTFICLTKLLRPNKIIFASIQSYNAFQYMNKNPFDFLKGVKIDFVPHASCKWWNKRANKYNNMTGKEKFITLLK